MHGCIRNFLAACLIAVPAVASAQVQPIAAPEQTPQQAPDQTFDQADSAPMAMPAEPDQSIWFQADWLWTMRSRTSLSTRDFIGGPDATNFNDMPAFDGSSGERIQAAAEFQGFVFEGIYTDWRGANSYMDATLNGVAFNGGITGNWIGRDFINQSTYFTAINSAATLVTPVNTLGDQSGLGPSTNFPNDPLPTLYAFYHSNFSMAEANVKENEFTLATFGGGGLRLGAGFVHANEDEVAEVVLSGTFRAVSNSGGATVSLPNSALISVPGGGLTLSSGGGTGFSDGTGGSGAVIPSELYFMHTAYTFNDLNGGQLVLDGDLVRYERFTIGGKIQAGIYDNHATGDVIEVYGERNRDVSVYYRAYTNTRDQAAFIGGAGLNAGYHITDHLLVTGGYEILSVSGLALAPQQANGISGLAYQVQTTGSIFQEAAHVGLEFVY